MDHPSMTVELQRVLDGGAPRHGPRGLQIGVYGPTEGRRHVALRLKHILEAGPRLRPLHEPSRQRGGEHREHRARGEEEALEDVRGAAHIGEGLEGRAHRAPGEPSQGRLGPCPSP